MIARMAAQGVAAIMASAFQRRDCSTCRRRAALVGSRTWRSWSGHGSDGTRQRQPDAASGATGRGWRGAKVMVVCSVRCGRTRIVTTRAQTNWLEVRARSSWVPGGRFRRKWPRLSVPSVLGRHSEHVDRCDHRTARAALVGGRAAADDDDCPVMPESADRIEREADGCKAAVVPVEAAPTPVEVCVPWPVTEPHPAARKIPTNSVADARRRSVRPATTPVSAHLPCRVDRASSHHTPTTSRCRFDHTRCGSAGGSRRRGAGRGRACPRRRMPRTR